MCQHCLSFLKREDCPDLGKDRQNPFMNFIAKRPGGLLAASSERASKKLHVEVDDDEETQ